jgi:hypothetical protein
MAPSTASAKGLARTGWQALESATSQSAALWPTTYHTSRVTVQHTNVEF